VVIVPPERVMTDESVSAFARHIDQDQSPPRGPAFVIRIKNEEEERGSKNEKGRDAVAALLLARW
jgi:hypothetical protein